MQIMCELQCCCGGKPETFDSGALCDLDMRSASPRAHLSVNHHRKSKNKAFETSRRLDPQSNSTPARQPLQASCLLKNWTIHVQVSSACCSHRISYDVPLEILQGSRLNHQQQQQQNGSNSTAAAAPPPPPPKRRR